MDRLPEKDRQIHISLYKNVHLLSTAYDNPKLYDGSRLQEHLRPDMFISTNKFAFEQIVYFLLNVITPDLTKNLRWPLLDKKLESEFRSAIKKTLNGLNATYEDARIPTIQTSQMITPGGIRVAKILFYLSEFAMLQYLEKFDDDESTLLPFVAGKNVSRQLQNIDKVIQCKYKQISETYQDIDNKMKKTIQIAEDYASLLSPFREEVEQLKEINDGIGDLNFSEFIDQISKNLNELKDYEVLLEQNRDVIHATVTNVHDSGYTFEKDSLNIREGIVRKILNNQNELNLMEFLKLIDEVLNDFIVHIKQQPKFDLTDLDALSLKSIQDYELFLNKMQSNYNPELQQLNTVLRANIDNYNEELLKKFHEDNSYLKQLKSPDIEFNLTSTSNQDFRSRLTARSLERRTSFFQTLTTAKKCNKRANTETTSSVKRNIMDDKAKSNPTPNANSTLQSFSSSIVSTQPAPNASSTPEYERPKLSKGPKNISEVRQLLAQDYFDEVSTSDESFNISQEILDVLKLDDDLNVS